jgi:hypothetical protein
MDTPDRQTIEQPIDMGPLGLIRLLLRIAVLRTMMFFGRLTRLLVMLGWY